MSVATSSAVGREGRVRARRVTGTDRLAGTGGLVFIGALVVQNVLRANAPGFDAAPAAVSAYFQRSGAAVLVPLGLFPIGMLALFAFVAAIGTRANTETHSRWWANLGTLGATAIAALFAVLNLAEIVLASQAELLAGAPAVVQTVWTLHAAAFGLDLAAIAIALLGLSRAAASSGLVPAWIALAALPGAASLLVAASFTIALASGGGGAWMALGLVGFLVWVVFVATASVSLLRGSIW